MIRTVFLDMDGVLVNFVKGVCNALGKSYSHSCSGWPIDYTFWNEWPDVTFGMVNAACNTKFWSQLEWMEDGHDILRAVVNRFDPEQIYLVTQPMPNVESATGKWLWVKRNLPEYYSQMITTPAGVPKALLAKPDTLLIDDKDENIEDFRAAGGHAILIARPWNKLYMIAGQTVDSFKHSIDVLRSTGVL